MKVVFAIGNPRPEYEFTYHNLGILLAEYFLKKTPSFKLKSTKKCDIYAVSNAQFVISNVYMNTSFDALRDIYHFFKLKSEDLLVLHDELSLKKFQFRCVRTEGLGGHNGLRDIARNIGPNFAKLRIGIDHPKNFNPNLSVSSYVLSRLDYEEWEKYFDIGVNEIQRWLS